MHNTPHPTDLRVGNQIRLRRKALRISQESLAEALGLTFQQVQKYEKGTNRVSASKLFDIANHLQVGVAFFFEGLDAADELDDPVRADIAEFMSSDMGHGLVVAALPLRAGSLQAVTRLLTTMANEGAGRHV